MPWINIIYLTWLELWQSRTYRILMVVAFLLPLGSVVLASLFMMDIGKVFMDGIAASSQLIAVVFLIFLAVALISRDIHDKVCYVLLAGLVTRKVFFIGRFAGLSLAYFALLCVLLLSASIAGYLFVEQKPDIYQSSYDILILAQMIFFSFFQYISIMGAVFFIVSWSTGAVESMVFTLAVLLFSWVFPPVLKAMQTPDVIDASLLPIQGFLKLIYELLPHLQGGEINLGLAHGETISWFATSIYMLEHSVYSLLFLVLGLLFFNRRDL